MRVVTIIGARPQFIKAAVVSHALRVHGIDEEIVHTGQHYDPSMSRVFFDELEIPEPSINLNAGSGSHAVQTGEIMVRLEAYLSAIERPDWVLVYGDTNSTLAGAVTAAKMNLRLAHVEAGLRSFNRRMPEEINRIITDRLSDLLLCPSRLAAENLESEGITDGVSITGDVMYDALLHYRERARRLYPVEDLIPFEEETYYLATIHRAETTDDPERMARLLHVFSNLDRTVVWPVHPRTRRRMTELGLSMPANVHPIEPVGYLPMLSLLEGAGRVLTDSGGLQKEAYWMRRPCLTLRTETEWVETVEAGWNHVVDLDQEKIDTALNAAVPQESPEVYGNGFAAERIVKLLEQNDSVTP